MGAGTHRDDSDDRKGDDAEHGDRQDGDQEVEGQRSSKMSRRTAGGARSDGKGPGRGCPEAWRSRGLAAQVPDFRWWQADSTSACAHTSPQGYARNLRRSPRMPARRRKATHTSGRRRVALAGTRPTPGHAAHHTSRTSRVRKRKPGFPLVTDRRGETGSYSGWVVLGVVGCGVIGCAAMREPITATRLSTSVTSDNVAVGGRTKRAPKCTSPLSLACPSPKP